MSAIEWTSVTYNPTVGCDKVSQGCKHCYAEVMAARLKAMGQKDYADGFKLRVHEHRLDPGFPAAETRHGPAAVRKIRRQSS